MDAKGANAIKITESDLQARIFNIQRFSIQDGPGIRTTVFFKGCPLTCRWCSNPESQKSDPELIFRSNNCQACGTCLDYCDQNAIALVNHKTTIDRALCNNCFKCVAVCCSGALEVAGKTLSLEQVFDEVCRDELFYRNSKGGVTLSGGEPLIQNTFAKHLLRLLKLKSIDTTIDTCGFVEWDYFESVLPFTDRFLFDLKHLDPESHFKATKVKNQLILENLVRLEKSRSAAIWIRIPVIPGFNDTETHFRQIRSFLENKTFEKVSLLSYHKWGISKYDALGRSDFWQEQEILSQDRLEFLKSIIEAGGLKVTIGY